MQDGEAPRWSRGRGWKLGTARVTVHPLGSSNPSDRESAVKIRHVPTFVFLLGHQLALLGGNAAADHGASTTRRVRASGQRIDATGAAQKLLDHEWNQRAVG